MAELARKTGLNDAPALISPPGYEYISEVGVATEIIKRGQGCVQSASGWSLAPAGAKEIHGVALMDYALNQDNCEFLKHGEMAGFTLAGGGALVPGTAIYPSGTIAGGLATDVVVWYAAATTPAVSVPVQPRMRACGTDRVFFNLV
jgi:hypothetical protein